MFSGIRIWSVVTRVTVPPQKQNRPNPFLATGPVSGDFPKYSCNKLKKRLPVPKDVEFCTSDGMDPGITLEYPLEESLLTLQKCSETARWILDETVP